MAPSVSIKEYSFKDFTDRLEQAVDAAWLADIDDQQLYSLLISRRWMWLRPCWLWSFPSQLSQPALDALLTRIIRIDDEAMRQELFLVLLRAYTHDTASKYAKASVVEWLIAAVDKLPTNQLETIKATCQHVASKDPSVVMVLPFSATYSPSDLQAFINFGQQLPAVWQVQWIWFLTRLQDNALAEHAVVLRDWLMALSDNFEDDGCHYDEETRQSIVEALATFSDKDLTDRLEQANVADWLADIDDQQLYSLLISRRWMWLRPYWLWSFPSQLSQPALDALLTRIIRIDDEAMRQELFLVLLRAYTHDTALKYAKALDALRTRIIRIDDEAMRQESFLVLLRAYTHDTASKYAKASVVEWLIAAVDKLPTNEQETIKATCQHVASKDPSVVMVLPFSATYSPSDLQAFINFGQQLPAVWQVQWIWFLTRLQDNALAEHAVVLRDWLMALSDNFEDDGCHYDEETRQSIVVALAIFSERLLDVRPDTLTEILDGQVSLPIDYHLLLARYEEAKLKKLLLQTVGGAKTRLQQLVDRDPRLCDAIVRQVPALVLGPPLLGKRNFYEVTAELVPDKLVRCVLGSSVSGQTLLWHILASDDYIAVAYLMDRLEGVPATPHQSIGGGFEESKGDDDLLQLDQCNHPCCSLSQRLGVAKVILQFYGATPTDSPLGKWLLSWSVVRWTYMAWLRLTDPNPLNTQATIRRALALVYSAGGEVLALDADSHRYLFERLGSQQWQQMIVGLAPEHQLCLLDNIFRSLPPRLGKQSYPHWVRGLWQAARAAGVMCTVIDYLFQQTGQIGQMVEQIPVLQHLLKLDRNKQVTKAFSQALQRQVDRSPVNVIELLHVLARPSARQEQSVRNFPCVTTANDDSLSPSLLTKAFEYVLSDDESSMKPFLYEPEVSQLVNYLPPQLSRSVRATMLAKAFTIPDNNATAASFIDDCLKHDDFPAIFDKALRKSQGVIAWPVIDLVGPTAPYYKALRVSVLNYLVELDNQHNAGLFETLDNYVADAELTQEDQAWILGEVLKHCRSNPKLLSRFFIAISACATTKALLPLVLKEVFSKPGSVPVVNCLVEVWPQDLLAELILAWDEQDVIDMVVFLQRLQDTVDPPQLQCYSAQLMKALAQLIKAQQANCRARHLCFVIDGLITHKTIPIESLDPLLDAFKADLGEFKQLLTLLVAHSRDRDHQLLALVLVQALTRVTPRLVRQTLSALIASCGDDDGLPVDTLTSLLDQQKLPPHEWYSLLAEVFKRCPHKLGVVAPLVAKAFEDHRGQLLLWGVTKEAKEKTRCGLEMLGQIWWCAAGQNELQTLTAINTICRKVAESHKHQLTELPQEGISLKTEVNPTTQVRARQALESSEFPAAWRQRLWLTLAKTAKIDFDQASEWYRLLSNQISKLKTLTVNPDRQTTFDNALALLQSLAKRLVRVIPSKDDTSVEVKLGDGYLHLSCAGTLFAPPSARYLAGTDVAQWLADWRERLRSDADVKSIEPPATDECLEIDPAESDADQSLYGEAAEAKPSPVTAAAECLPELPGYDVVQVKQEQGGGVEGDLSRPRSASTTSGSSVDGLPPALITPPEGVKPLSLSGGTVKPGLNALIVPPTEAVITTTVPAP